jgi:hypothetical protein
VSRTLARMAVDLYGMRPTPREVHEPVPFSRS